MTPADPPFSAQLSHSLTKMWLSWERWEVLDVRRSLGKRLVAEPYTINHLVQFCSFSKLLEMVLAQHFQTVLTE